MWSVQLCFLILTFCSFFSCRGAKCTLKTAVFPDASAGFLRVGGRTGDYKLRPRKPGRTGAVDQRWTYARWDINNFTQSQEYSHEDTCWRFCSPKGGRSKHANACFLSVILVPQFCINIMLRHFLLFTFAPNVSKKWASILILLMSLANLIFFP